jgi:hypothetical protein
LIDCMSDSAGSFPWRLCSWHSKHDESMACNDYTFKDFKTAKNTYEVVEVLALCWVQLSD